MELKLLPDFAFSKCFPLLIVPYGIETPCCEVQRIQPGLLIVPYGIETRLFLAP